MRRRTAPLVLLCIVAASSSAVYRYVQTMPVGTGETTASPDGRFTASIMDWTRRDYFGGTAHRWFEYKVEGEAGSYRIVTRPVDGPYFGSRSSHHVIRWWTDSSAVDFIFPNRSLQIPTDAIDD
jgi:hypothetical protein